MSQPAWIVSISAFQLDGGQTYNVDFSCDSDEGLEEMICDVDPLLPSLVPELSPVSIDLPSDKIKRRLIADETTVKFQKRCAGFCMYSK